MFVKIVFWKIIFLSYAILGSGIRKRSWTFWIGTAQIWNRNATVYFFRRPSWCFIGHRCQCEIKLPLRRNEKKRKSYELAWTWASQAQFDQRGYYTKLLRRSQKFHQLCILLSKILKIIVPFPPLLSMKIITKLIY